MNRTTECEKCTATDKVDKKQTEVRGGQQKLVCVVLKKRDCSEDECCMGWHYELINRYLRHNFAFNYTIRVITTHRMGI